MTANRVLVTAATSPLGAAIVRRLLEHGHEVYALTRKPDSSAAGALRSAGATIRAGSYDDHASLLHAAASVDSIVVLTTPCPIDPERERRHAEAVIDAARGLALPYLVYLSSAGVGDGLRGASASAKRKVEHYLHRHDDVPSTILRPTLLMEGVAGVRAVLANESSSLRLPVSAAASLPLIAERDLAGVIASALERPKSLAGLTLSIASDRLTGPQMASALSRVTGAPVEFESRPRALVDGPVAEAERFLGWLAEHPDCADPPQLRREFPAMTWQRFEEWARAHHGAGHPSYREHTHWGPTRRERR